MKLAAIATHLLLAALVALPLSGQETIGTDAEPETLVAVNALIGGLTAGVGSALSGKSFVKGFVRGLPSGIVIYEGKRIVARQGGLNSWIGRQLAAVGTSEISNAAAGRPFLSRLVVPLGPGRVYIERSPRFSLRPTIDIAALLVALTYSGNVDATFDGHRSLTHGLLIFSDPWGRDDKYGSSAAGVMRVDNDPAGLQHGPRQFYREGVISHELIHAIQYDFAQTVLGEPAERLMLSYIPGGSRLHKYVDFGISAAAWGMLNNHINPNQQPWETEAHTLAPGYNK